MKASRLWILLLLQLAALSAAIFEQLEMLSIENTNAKDNELHFWLLQLFRQLQQEIRYDNILSFQEQTAQQNCVFPNLLQRLNVPMLLVASKEKWRFDYRFHYSQQVLVLHCCATLNATTRDIVLHGGLELRALHHIIYVHTFPLNEVAQQMLLATYCRYAFKAMIYKVLLILHDFGQTQRYFQCRLYPLEAKYPYRSKKLFIQEEEEVDFVYRIYDEIFYNMHGATIWTQPDQLAPRVTFKTHNVKPTQMFGYIGALVVLYAERRNATLRFRFPVSYRKAIHPLTIVDATKNGSVDIGATYSSPIVTLATGECTYIYDVCSYCFMVPLPSRLSIKLVPLSIMSVPVLFIILLYMFIYGCLLLYSIVGSWRRLTYVNSIVFFDMVRAMLAQSYVMVPRPSRNTKFLYFLISFSCYVVANMYLAFLQSFLTQPPLLPQIVDYADVSKAGLKILFPSEEHRILKDFRSDLLISLSNLLWFIDNYTEFDRQRNSLNTKYIYPVSQRRWIVFTEHQKLLKRPIYFFSENLCILDNMPIGLPIRADLPYRELVDEFILRVCAVGLREYWSSLHFYQMVRLGILTIKDLSKVEEEESTGEAINMNDLYYIWIAYLCLIGVAVVEFIFEIFWNACFKSEVSVRKFFSKNFS